MTAGESFLQAGFPKIPGRRDESISRGLTLMRMRNTRVACEHAHKQRRGLYPDYVDIVVMLALNSVCAYIVQQ